MLSDNMMMPIADHTIG